MQASVTETLVPTLVVINRFRENNPVEDIIFQDDALSRPLFNDPKDTVGTLPQWLEALSSILHSINSDVTMSVLLDNIAHTACSLLKLNKCSVMLADRSEERLRVVGSAGLSQSYLDLVNGSRPITLSENGPRYSSPSAQAYLTKSIVLIPSASDASEFSPWRDMAQSEGYEALIAAPLADEGNPLGVIVGYAHSRRTFSNEQIDSIQLLAKFASTALMTARLRGNSRIMIDELHQANKELLENQRTLANLDLQHDQLMRTVAANVGVSGVLTALANLFRVPVCLQDIYGPVIAEERLDYQNTDFHERNQLMRTVDQWSTSRLSAPQQLADGSITVRPIILDSTPVALLWVGPNQRGQGQAASQALDRFALVVALELAKELPLKEAKYASARDVVAHLTTSDEPAALRSAMGRASSLGLDPTTQLQVAIIGWPTSSPREGDTNLLNLCERIVHGAMFTSLIGGNNDRVTLLLATANTGHCDALLEDVLRQLRRRDALTGIRGIVTSAPQGSKEIPRLHRALTGTLDFTRVEASNSLTRIDALGSTGILLTHGDPETLSAFAHQVLGALLDPHGTSPEQLHTLNAWIDSGCTTTTTARQIHVHPNTVKYRLKNIEKQLKLDLRDTRALTDIRLALDIARLMGLSHLLNETKVTTEI